MSRITILGIDPGLTNTGYNISIYDTNKGTTKVQQFDLITAINVAKKENKKDYKIYGNIIPLFVYERLIDDIITKYQPDYICSEDAFYNPRTPNAFFSLKSCILTIERVLYKHEKVLYKIPPKKAKLAIGRATANKEAVQELIQNLPDLSFRKTDIKSINKMTEHEADSVAITYAFVKTILEHQVSDAVTKI